MKSLSKRIGVFIAMLCVVMGMYLFIVASKPAVTVEASSPEQQYNYFYNQISKDARAEKFYQAFGALEKDGEFKKGKVEYDLVAKEVISQSDVDGYVNNADTKVPKAYGKGRDAYIMDHPDLFYVDLFGTSISAGQQGKDYVAFLDTSQVLSLYLGDLNTQAKVNTAIDTYEKKLAAIVTEAKAAGGVKEQIEFVNQYIAEHTEYSFGTIVKDGKNVDTPEAAYISTAYGSLVNGKAICGGYAKGFKAVMDRLGIPCVCVQGYSLSSGSTQFQAHMWNYVQVDNMWYAVDPTWNDTSGDLTKWLLVGEKKLSDTHVEDNIISTSGFELSYPALKPYDYGIDTDDNGMKIEGNYIESSDNTGRRLTLTVSYEGKGAQKLEEEGKYLVFRFGDKVGTEMNWTLWFNAIATDTMFASLFKFEDDHIEVMLHAGMEYIQFALVDYAPDESYGAFYPNEPQYGENAGKEWFYAYKNENLTSGHFLGDLSNPYHNDAYGEYIPAPGAAGVTPSNGGTLPVDKTYDITITYNKDLKLLENKTEEDITMDFFTSSGNSTVKDHAIVTNVKWDGGKKISFTFTPSRMFIHNSAMYYFTPTNLVGIDSDKAPTPVTYSFKGKSVVCSKIFNDGRLYMNVYGEPQMLDTSDLSVTNFKDENGNYYAESQRSQLILVANKPSISQEKKMDEVLKSDTPIKQEDIVTSATYEINLQICGVVQKVPNGSYMQVAFGFPEGYSPDDAGTTFKIYHYKHDDKGNITGVEEIPVIITEYGLIAQVKSFSPFTIVQLKNTSEAVSKDTSKSIYANVIGNGGTITTQKAEGQSGIDQVTQDSITYTISANAGYQLGTVFLNGKAVDASRIKDGKLTLTKAELETSNTLEVKFRTIEAAQSYEAKGIEITDVKLAVNIKDSEAEEPTTPDQKPNPDPTPDETPTTPTPDTSSNHTTIIICCVVVAIVVVAAAVSVVIFLKKKKNNKD
jgi:Uncharacterized protein involved in cytokinesis, contains TGc (transglutaminase/protease-like) domain